MSVCPRSHPTLLSQESAHNVGRSHSRFYGCWRCPKFVDVVATLIDSFRYPPLSANAKIRHPHLVPPAWSVEWSNGEEAWRSQLSYLRQAAMRVEDDLGVNKLLSERGR